MDWTPFGGASDDIFNTHSTYVPGAEPTNGIGGIDIKDMNAWWEKLMFKNSLEKSFVFKEKAKNINMLH